MPRYSNCPDANQWEYPWSKTIKPSRLNHYPENGKRPESTMKKTKGKGKGGGKKDC